MAATGQYQLEIDDSIELKRGFLTQISLVYAGMPNDHTFSLAVIKGTGHRGMAYNLYLPTDQRHIEIAKNDITINSVSATTCLLTIN